MTKSVKRRNKYASVLALDCQGHAANPHLLDVHNRSIISIMSVVLSALRSIIATLLGVVLVLFERAIVRRTHALSHARTAFDLRRRVRPVVSFNRHPPEAWAAP
ncbi:hypothetical protein SAMN05428950_1011466 [Sphingomonas sp. OV641]|nr:hypothetical protein SAMN05428950_1011466 [Sphingomonas sp. OV641]